MKFKFVIFASVFFSLICIINSCTSNTKNNNSEEVEIKIVTKPVSGFSQDSAFAFIQKQLSFGYRVSGTKEHEK